MSSISTSEWLVILGGLAGIAWVNWYFFLAGRTSAVAMVAASNATTTGSAAPAEVTITVDGGYSPRELRVKAGQPVRLVFDRRDTGSCSDEVVFPDFGIVGELVRLGCNGIRRFLPTGQRTTVEITPAKPGRYDFTCGMSMLRGAIVAEE